jgi:hypothetical protein
VVLDRMWGHRLAGPRPARRAGPLPSALRRHGPWAGALEPRPRGKFRCTFAAKFLYLGRALSFASR